jgi:hypothetical protein
LRDVVERELGGRTHVDDLVKGIEVGYGNDGCVLQGRSLREHIAE